MNSVNRALKTATLMESLGLSVTSLCFDGSRFVNRVYTYILFSSTSYKPLTESNAASCGATAIEFCDACWQVGARLRSAKARFEPKHENNKIYERFDT